MKRTILLLLTVVTSMMVMAEGITAEQAVKIARQFVNHQQMAAQGPSMGSGQARQMRMAAKRQMPMSMATEANSNAYYVFNIGSNDGYVMVSGSDLTPQVLGYASEGSFDEDNMPANMKAWLDGYAEQIAYIERTQGSNQAPVLHISGEAIDPLLTSTWGQSAPYNDMCPVIDGKQAPTGCGNTAMAQVINYYKYPAQTVTAIPAYTTLTKHIDMPEMPVTDIDWANMLDDYIGNETAEQKNAVATLMRLCGQAAETDYQSDFSGSFLQDNLHALREYFGYEGSMNYLLRESFSASEWENIIYNELDNGRPVLYGGQSTGGGHGFVVDGYDGNGLYHINWGWGGSDDGYFVLSVLNPYNNTATGASSSDDGFSFTQEAIVGIQPETGEKHAERLSVFGIFNKGANSYTRASASEDFPALNISIKFVNMTGGTHEFSLGLRLYRPDGEVIQLLTSKQLGAMANNLGTKSYALSPFRFGAYLTDGDYYITPVSRCENSEDWEPCWGSDIYRIKATISGNTLTLTPPIVDLSATFVANDSATVYMTINVQAQVTNNGTDFHNYVYLAVDNKIVGGKMFEVKAGETATFDIDYMPTTPGTKTLTLCYEKDHGFAPNEYVSIGSGSITIGELGEGEPHLAGTITLTNGNSQGNVEGTTANISAVIRNTGDGAFLNGVVILYLYKQKGQSTAWSYITYDYKTVNIMPGDSIIFNCSYKGLEVGGRYRIVPRLTLDNGKTYEDIEATHLVFIVEEGATGIEMPQTSSEPFDVFTTTGVKVKSQVTSLKGLPQGVYIVNKKKVLVK